MADKRLPVKGTLIAAIGSGLVFAPGAFIFQIMQSWVSAYDVLPRSLFIWLMPTAVTACYILTVGLAYSVVISHRRDHPIDPSSQFRAAVILYADALVDQNRDPALLDLREGVGGLFHTQSANADRIKLGELALAAALRQHQTERQVAILIDDLGWANHMAGNSAVAVDNIDRAIEIVDILPRDQLSGGLRFLRSKAKRHKAIIESRRDLSQAQALVVEAQVDVMAAFPEGIERETELGQLMHAKALLVATNIDILDGRRRIRADDQQFMTLSHEALTSVRQAKAMFLKVQSLSKYAKSLYLEHCILNAIGREIEAREVKTVLDDLLARSVWEAGNSQTNIRGG